MTPTEHRTEIGRKVLSHAYAFLDAIIAFFAVWQFALMMRIVVGLSTDVYWLAKAWIQQVSFIAVSILMFVAIIGGQHLFERAMLKKKIWLPKSFFVITAALAAAYAAFEIVILTY
jgi:hypothetical protein